MSRARQLRIENLEQDQKKLENDYEAVAEKKRRESNPQEQNNLQLQLEDISEQIKRIEQDIKELKQEEQKERIQSLLSILTTSIGNLLTATQKSYKACSPEGWLLSTPEKIEQIVEELKVMPQGSSKHTRVEHFVACLVADKILPSSVIDQLCEWGKQNINNFSELLYQEKKNLEIRNRNTNSYLLILLKRSEQKSAISHTSEVYTIEAWIIQDIQTYNYELGIGCEQLTFSDFYDQTLTIDEIPKVLKKILDKISPYSCRNLTIEIFLPLALLNHSVDRWELEDDLDLGFPPIIGHDYKVVVRSCERLTEAYQRRRARWESKWEQLRRASDSGGFILVDDETVNNLINKLKLPEIFGLRAQRAPKKIGRGSIFAAILETAIPVAWWVRQNLPDSDCQSEMEQILSCCVTNLPEFIQRQRLQAQPNTDTHLGHHLSLLWEDPYRLPPSIRYLI